MNERSSAGPTDRPEALRAALDLEQKGHDYYRETASRAGNPLTQKVFSALADDEIRHKERIRELYEGAGSGAGFLTPRDALENTVKEFFARFTQSERAAWQLDDAGAYEHAMELERQSYSLYEALAGRTQSQAEAEFFRQVQHEESEHFTALENALNYLQRTGDWFASEEGRVWNWMNM